MYEVPASKKSLKQNQFDVKLDGRVFRVPSMKYIKPSVVADADTMSQVAGSRYLIESVAPGMFDLFDDAEQIQDFMTAWQEFSGITSGESSASTDS